MIDNDMRTRLFEQSHLDLAVLDPDVERLFADMDAVVIAALARAHTPHYPRLRAPVLRPRTAAVLAFDRTEPSGRPPPRIRATQRGPPHRDGTTADHEESEVMPPSESIPRISSNVTCSPRVGPRTNGGQPVVFTTTHTRSGPEAARVRPYTRSTTGADRTRPKGIRWHRTAHSSSSSPSWSVSRSLRSSASRR